jgi:hypothetical protein
MAGLSGAVNAELPYIPAPAYLKPVLLHAFYGIFLFLLVITIGVGSLKIAGRYTRLTVDDLNILGFAAGLVACLGVALLSLLGAGGQLVAGAVLIAALASFRRHLANGPAIGFYRGAFIILLAIAFGSHFAFMWRPATAEYAGAIDLGDLTLYMGWYFSLEKSLFPFYNLGVEGQVFSAYFNNLHNIYALALNFLPHFDIYLFTTASLGTFYIISISWLLRALLAYRSRLGYADLSLGHVLMICALFLAAARTPSWIGESPPAVFMVPIVLAVMYAVARAGDRPARLAFALVFAVVGSAISKVVSIAVLGSYTGLQYLQRVLRHPKPVHRLYLGVAASLGAIYVTYMIGKFGSHYFPEWVPGPESWHRFQRKGWSEFHRVIPTLLKDLGLLLVLAGIFKLRNRALFIACAFGISCHFIFPFLFTPTPTAMLVLLAGYILVTRDIPKAASSLILVGAILILPHHLKRDVGKHYMTLVWIITLGPAVFVALHNNLANATAHIHRRNSAHALMLFTSTLTLSLSLVAVASGDLRLGKKRHKTVSTTLYDIWLKTRQLTPADALIFTDQTGDENGRLTGWNDYSLMAQRQFFLSTWVSSKLRYDVSKRHQGLSYNEAILSGGITPASLPFTRNYGSYYAVVTADRPAPSAFRTVYANADYVLYQIKSETYVNK